MTAATDSRHAVSRALLHGSGLEIDDVVEVAQATLREDLAWGPDLTTEATIAPGVRGAAHVVAHADGVVAGLAVAAAVVEVLGDAGTVEVDALVADGDRVGDGEALMRVAGPLRILLTAERSLLNLLCQLSGVATETARWVDAVHGSQAAIRDTRKTVPGLRVLQKYAVRCGGGVNHRMGLGDAALVKDNHVAAAGSIAAAFHAVRDRHPAVAIEVECDTLEQVAEAVRAGAQLVLLDNMDTETMRRAVALARAAGVRLEASGGLTLPRAAEVAATGVDYISIGALTHSAPALDLGLDLDSAAGSSSSA